MNEERFNRKHIDTKIRAAIEADADMQDKLQMGIMLVTAFLADKTYYQSKLERLAQMEQMDVPALVMDIFVGIAYCQRAELFTSVTAQMASRLKFSDKVDAIKTVSELMAVLCQTDAFDVFKEGKMTSLMVESRIPLPEALIDFIENSQYLPPMVCAPLELTHNFSSGYLTHNDSLILGSGNHHDGDLCLDVLNTMNNVALKLDLEFVCKHEEEPGTEITVANTIASALEKGRYMSEGQAVQETAAALENWTRFKTQSYSFYSLMEQQGNRFYLTHKWDKRGRAYSCGYHISTQGTAHKKAMLEFAEEVLIEGVPS